MTRNRKDQSDIASRGEVSEKTAAAMIGVTPTTLAKWRKLGFARQGYAPRWHYHHRRLVAYVAAEVELLKKVMRGDIGPDHPALA